MSNNYGSIFGQAQRAFEDTRATDFEHTKVSFVMDELGLGKIKHRLRGLSSNGRLTFELLRAHYQLPFFLACSDLGGMSLQLRQDAVLPCWFRDLRRLPFFPFYRKLKVEWAAYGLPLGLVFPRKGLKQGLVLHNGGIVASGGVPAFTQCVDDEELVVQSFRSLIFHWRKL